MDVAAIIKVCGKAAPVIFVTAFLMRLRQLQTGKCLLLEN